jgi:hypothetical protein
MASHGAAFCVAAVAFTAGCHEVSSIIAELVGYANQDQTALKKTD